MANKITRTTATTTATFILYDRGEKTMVNHRHSFSGKITDEKELIALCNKYLKNEEFLQCMDVAEIEIVEELREMDLDTWMKYSKVVPTEE